MIACENFLKMSKPDLIFSGRPSKGRRNLELEGRSFLQAVRNANVAQLDKPLCSESVELIARFNRGALLELYFGDIEKAEAICRRAIDVRFSEPTDAPISSRFWSNVSRTKDSSRRPPMFISCWNYTSGPTRGLTAPVRLRPR
jgi:hypothetical protein